MTHVTRKHEFYQPQWM